MTHAIYQNQSNPWCPYGCPIATYPLYQLLYRATDNQGSVGLSQCWRRHIGNQEN